MSDLKKEVLEFLKTNPIMAAAVNSEGAPISTILLFTIDDDFKICFASRKDTYKADAIKVDPRVSISVWKMGEMSIQATGRVKEVTEENKMESILDGLAESVGKLDDFWPPVLQMNESDYIVYEMEVLWMRKLDLKKNEITDKGQIFEQVI